MVTFLRWYGDDDIRWRYQLSKEVQARNFRYTLFEGTTKKEKKREKKESKDIYIYTSEKKSNDSHFSFQRQYVEVHISTEVSHEMRVLREIRSAKCCVFPQKLRLRSVNSKLRKVSERPCTVVDV